MHKRGYFFTLDAFVAVIILVIGIFLLLSLQSSKPYDTQALYISQDIMASISKTKVTEMNQPYINALRLNGTIRNYDNTIIEQAGEFYAANDRAAAREFAKAATLSIVPPQYGYRISINNDLIYNNSAIPQDTKIISTSKTIVYGILNRTKMWGPYTAEMTTWQR